MMDTDRLVLKVVDVVDGDWQGAGVAVHDQTNRGLAHMLVEMPFGAFPMALGVLYCDPAPTYEAAVREQLAKAKRTDGASDLQALMRRGPTWEVGSEAGGG